MRQLPRLLMIAATGLAACQGSTEPVAPAGPIRMIAGANITDTAGATLTQALIVEVHDSAGGLAPLGTVVRFGSVLAGLPSAEYEAWVQTLSSNVVGAVVFATTDGAGRTSVLVKLG